MSDEEVEALIYFPPSAYDYCLLADEARRYRRALKALADQAEKVSADFHHPGDRRELRALVRLARIHLKKEKS